MSQSTLHLLIVGGIALALGILAAWRMRGMLKALVVYFTPRKYRFRTHLQAQQNRLSKLLGILAAVAITALLYWGGQAILTSFERSSKTTIVPIKDPAPATEPPRTFPEQQEVQALDTLPPEATVTTYREKAVGTEYLQLDAFQIRANAERSQLYWSSRLDESVYIGLHPTDTIPYKVLVGAFFDTAAVRRYKTRHRLDGYPRSGQDVRLLTD